MIDKARRHCRLTAHKFFTIDFSKTELLYNSLQNYDFNFVNTKK